MVIAIVDGLGGSIGCRLVSGLAARLPEGVQLIALGTNAIAAQRMIDAGAARGASGENAVRFSIAEADIIAGPWGVVLANAMMGEVSPAMAEAILGAKGKKVLIPLSHPLLELVGLSPASLGALVDAAIEKVLALADQSLGR